MNGKYKYTSLLFVITTLWGLGLCGNVLADIPIDKDEKLKLYGDFRLRQEADFDSMQSNGIERKDRNRTRIRFRLGAKYEPLDDLLINVRGRTGAIKSQQSPHLTVIESGWDVKGDFFLDTASIKYSPNDFWLKVGRDELPFWKQNEIMWDDDVYLDGGAFGYKHSLADDVSLSLNGGYFLLPDGDDNFSASERSQLTAVQIVYKNKIGEGDFTNASGYLYVNDENSVVNSTNQNQDYRIWNINFQYNLNVADIPLSLGADYMRNFENYPSSLFNRGERNGYVLQAELGKLKEKRDWLLGYYYARIEKYAVAFNFAQDDWVRWGSSTQARSSNLKGHEIRLAYAFARNFNVVLRTYLVDAIKTESATSSAKEDGNRIRLDFNFKF